MPLQLCPPSRALVTNQGQKLCFIHGGEFTQVISTAATVRTVSLNFGQDSFAVLRFILDRKSTRLNSSHWE